MILTHHPRGYHSSHQTAKPYGIHLLVRKQQHTIASQEEESKALKSIKTANSARFVIWVRVKS
ncbi:hypothetical protein QQP08_007462 [Theobroma cacao]|nr:hypothetical protein QQP08_007462 [Theobroma cacao]